jgi:hypothetical protein
VNVDCHDSLVMQLSPANLAVFQFLPTEVRQQLLLDRDPHGNVQVLSHLSSWTNMLAAARHMCLVQALTAA